MQTILANHGQGAPVDHVDSSNNQLTTKSTAVRSLESITHPMDNALSGIPSWAMSSQPIGHGRKKDSSDRAREEIRVLRNPNELYVERIRSKLYETDRDVWRNNKS